MIAPRRALLIVMFQLYFVAGVWTGQVASATNPGLWPLFAIMCVPTLMVTIEALFDIFN